MEIHVKISRIPLLSGVLLNVIIHTYVAYT